MTPGDFTTAFPAFKDVDVSVIAAAIADSAPFFEDPTRYGDFLAPAQNYCVAFFVFLRLPTADDPQSNPGNVVSEDRPTIKFTRSEKLLERAYVEPFESNQYGRMFLYYQRLAGIGGAAAAGCDSAYPLTGPYFDGGWSG